MLKHLDFESKSLNDTEHIANNFLTEIMSIRNKYPKAVVVGLIGNLGSGKTAFTKFVGKSLGVVDMIQSPTFVLQKIYDTPHSVFKKLYHLDMYRIEDPAELAILHLDDVFKDPQNLVLIEWPKKAEKDGVSALPNDMIQIRFEFKDDISLRISYDLF